MTMTIPADQHFLSLSDLLSSGFSYYKINKLVSDGKFIKLNNKTYENTAYSGETSDFETVSVYAPRVNVSIMAYLDRTRIPISIDIGFGDVIVPERVMMDSPVVLSDEIPRIYA